MIKSRLWCVISSSIYIFLSSPSFASLIDNGGGLIYDDVLNITWAQPETTVKTWEDSNAWVATLTLGGVSGWRLPYASVAEGSGPLANPVDCSAATELSCRDNELGYMFYHNLSGTSGNGILSSNDPDLNLFPALQDAFYFSGTERDTDNVWVYSTGIGAYGSWPKNGVSNFAWAVHAGNVTTVPVPAAVSLFGSGLLGLIGISRRKRVA